MKGNWPQSLPAKVVEDPEVTQSKEEQALQRPRVLTVLPEW